MAPRKKDVGLLEKEGPQLETTPRIKETSDEKKLTASSTSQDQSSSETSQVMSSPRKRYHQDNPSTAPRAVMPDQGPSAPGPPHRPSALTRRVFEAISAGQGRTAVKLMGVCANPKSATDETGRSFLQAVLDIPDARRREHMFSLLTAAHLDCLAVDSGTGRSVLMSCICSGRPTEALYVLEMMGAEIDLLHKDRDGRTALHHAVVMDFPEVLYRLLEMHAHYRLPVDAQDKLGLSPYLYARKLGRHHLCDLLRNEGKCSVHQFDSLRFMTSDDWAKEGERDRKRAAMRFLKKTIDKQRMMGRADRYVEQEVAAAMSQDPAYHSYTLPNKSHLNKSMDTVISMLDLVVETYPEEASAPPQTYCSSTSIVDHLPALMTIKSEQLDPSYRKAARAPTPPPVVEKVIPARKKRSTLSIIFRANRKRVVTRKSSDAPWKARSNRPTLTRSSGVPACRQKKPSSNRLKLPPL